MNYIGKSLHVRVRRCLCLKSTNEMLRTRIPKFSSKPNLQQSNKYSTATSHNFCRPFSGLNIGLSSTNSDWLKFCSSSSIFRTNFLQNDVRNFPVRIYSTSEESKEDKENKKDEKNTKMTLFQKFKQMYRDYWYVLIPVHCGTSIIWFGGFYMAAESGVDIVGILEFFKVSDKLIDPFRNGHAKMGYIAVAFALYKLASPLRYAVTLGGTTVSINYLKKFGYIKPIPKKEQLKEIYLEKKDIFMERKQQFSENINQMKPFNRLKEVEGSKRK